MYIYYIKLLGMVLALFSFLSHNNAVKVSKILIYFYIYAKEVIVTKICSLRIYYKRPSLFRRPTIYPHGLNLL